MSNTHVRQLDRGMDLGPAHKNIALNHLVARGSHIPDTPDPAFERLVPGDEDDNPTACVKAIKAAREHTVEDLFSEPTAPQAYITDTDRVYCEWCHEARFEDRCPDHMDNDPNYWLFKVMDWQPGHHCHDCGTTDGTNCEKEPEPPKPRLQLPLYTTPEQRANHIIGAAAILDALAEARANGHALPQLPQ